VCILEIPRLPQLFFTIAVSTPPLNELCCKTEIKRKCMKIVDIDVAPVGVIEAQSPSTLFSPAD
jgi:hypothetical protein